MTIRSVWSRLGDGQVASNVAIQRGLDAADQLRTAALAKRRAFTHTTLAVIAAAASVYLVVDHDRMVDLVVEDLVLRAR